MNRYYYDLHVHSCLSPCADNDNTPNNIAGMASLCGLNILALTDHNTAKNCPAFFESAKRYGIVPIPGMELTTAEDIHIVCLLPTLEDAMDFDSFVDSKRVRIKNRTDIFGDQLILDCEDNIVGVEEDLLSNATMISISDVVKEVDRFNGVCYPAHIDRQANGVISVLGTFPKEPHFGCAELHDRSKIDEYVNTYELGNRHIIISSDAHCLTDFRDRENSFLLDDEPYSSALVRRRLIDYLKEKK